MMAASVRPADRRRQFGLLVALLLVLAVIVYRQTGTPSPASNLPGGAALQDLGLVLPEPVKLATLDDVPASTEIGRNPFTFGVRPAPPSAPHRAVRPPPSPGTPPPPLPPPGPPPIPLRVTGMTKVPGSERTMVTLKDPASGMVFQAFEGDVVDGRYRVVKVGEQSVVLSYLDGTGTRAVQLGG